MAQAAADPHPDADPDPDTVVATTVVGRVERDAGVHAAGRTVAGGCDVKTWRERQREREGFTEYMEGRHFRVMESGVDLPPSPSADVMPGLRDRVRTTVDWAVRNGCPVQHGRITKVWDLRNLLLGYVVPARPSLLPVEGVWLPLTDLERDDA